MNADSELVVINASGASRVTIVKPILMVAVAASILCFVVQNGVEPYARQKNRDLVASARADFLSLVIQEGTFRKVENGLFVQIGERLPGNQLGGIFVADSRQEGTDLVYYAKRGAVIDQGDDKALLMTDGVIHRKSVDGNVSLVHFTSYAFDLSAFGSNTGGVVRLPKDQTTQYLLNPDPNDDAYKKAPGTYRSEINKRFSEWLFPITFALIALAVAGDARSHREARIHPLVTTICIALLVRWMAFFAEGQSRTEPILGYLMYVIPVGMALVSIWFIRTQRAMELPIGLIDMVVGLVGRVLGAFASFRYRSVNSRRGSA
jgi:lipopolysaccharide export system permease protein